MPEGHILNWSLEQIPIHRRSIIQERSLCSLDRLSNLFEWLCIFPRNSLHTYKSRFDKRGIFEKSILMSKRNIDLESMNHSLKHNFLTRVKHIVLTNIIAYILIDIQCIHPMNISHNLRNHYSRWSCQYQDRFDFHHQYHYQHHYQCCYQRHNQHYCQCLNRYCCRCCCRCCCRYCYQHHSRYYCQFHCQYYYHKLNLKSDIQSLYQVHSQYRTLRIGSGQ